jgi:NIPSNAP
MSTRTEHRATAIHDFDFLVGTWTSRQRRLTQRLQGNDDWETFNATSTVQQLPGGIINFDTLVAEDWRPGWVGMSLRVFNPVTNLWSIHWVTNDGGGIDAKSGQLDAAVVGRFQGDEGVFEGDDVFEGRPIRVRFRWQRQGADRARWEQAFSDDGGRSWETNWVMAFERAAVAHAALPSIPAADLDCEVVELRQYTLHPGQRETLIELFDREFVQAQEAAGMAVMGQFRDLDVPDRFVWLRGFADWASRARSLDAFYGGSVWQQHRSAANAMMIDSDNVLLLRPAWPGAGVAMRGRSRAAAMVRMARPGLLDTCIFDLHEPATPALLQFCRDAMTPCLQRGGADVLGWYVTDSRPNNFPQLPVREGENVLVGLVMFDDVAAFDAFMRDGAWEREVQPGLSPWLHRAPQSHRLVATARSAIHA